MTILTSPDSNPPTPPAADLTGEFAKRIAMSYDRLAGQCVVPHFTTEFILADVTLNPETPRRFYNFSGDLSGRYVEVISLFSNHAGQSSDVNLHALVSELIRHQRADGRFGRSDLTFTRRAGGRPLDCRPAYGVAVGKRAAAGWPDHLFSAARQRDRFWTRPGGWAIFC